MSDRVRTLLLIPAGTFQTREAFAAALSGPSIGGLFELLGLFVGGHLRPAMGLETSLREALEVVWWDLEQLRQALAEEPPWRFEVDELGLETEVRVRYAGLLAAAAARFLASGRAARAAAGASAERAARATAELLEALVREGWGVNRDGVRGEIEGAFPC